MKLANTNRFFLAGTRRRYLHMATVFYGLREYMCFVDVYTTRVYIERIIGGQLEFINDDSLAEGLHNFLVYKEVLLMNQPLLPDAEWLKKLPERY